MRGIRGAIGDKGGAAARAPLSLAAIPLAGLALVALALPAAPVDARAKRFAPRLIAGRGFGAFTPAAADPRLAAAFARTGLGAHAAGIGSFRFTPSGSGISRRAITVAVRARAITRGEAARALSLASAGSAPSAYNLGVSLGWRRFALSGDVIRADAGLLPESRESADIGVSYVGNRWATKVDLAADRAAGDRPVMIGIDQSWSVGFGGSYALTRNLDVTGGVRYKLQRDQLKSIVDDRRDSQAVYLGTTFRF